MSTKVLATATRQEEEIKGINTGKEKVRLSLLPSDLVVYVVNLKHSYERQPDLIGKFSKNLRLQKSCTQINSML